MRGVGSPGLALPFVETPAALADGSGAGATGASSLGSGGDKAGGQLDLVKRHHPHGHEADHEADCGWDAAVATAPTPDMPHVDVEQSGSLALRDTDPIERAREFGRGCGARASSLPAKRCFLPSRVARVADDRERTARRAELDRGH